MEKSEYMVVVESTTKHTAKVKIFAESKEEAYTTVRQAVEDGDLAELDTDFDAETIQDWQMASIPVTDITNIGGRNNG